MAYQKLQVERALKVIPSDTINIPNVSGTSTSGATDGAVPNKLVDSGATFSTNLVGYIVYNTTDSTVARVTAVDSGTVLTLSANIMGTGENYVVYEDNNNGCVLQSGAAGTIRVLTAGGDDVTFSVVAGAFIPVQVVKVFTSGTMNSPNIIALW
jgi:hypothetical protein